MKKTGKNRLISLMLTLTMALALPVLALPVLAANNTHYIVNTSSGATGEVTWATLASGGDQIAGLAEGDNIVINNEPPSGGATLSIIVENVTVKLNSSFDTDIANPLTINVADGVNSLVLQSVPVSGVTVNFKDTDESTLTVIGHITLTKLEGGGDLEVVGSDGSGLTVGTVDFPVASKLGVGVPVEVTKELPDNADVVLTSSFPARLMMNLQTGAAINFSSDVPDSKWATNLENSTFVGVESSTPQNGISIPANTSTTIFVYDAAAPYGEGPSSYYIGVNELDAAIATSGGAAMVPWGCVITDSSGNYHIPDLAADRTLIFTSDNPKPTKPFLIGADGVKVSTYGTVSGYSGEYYPNNVNLLTADTVSSLALARFTSGDTSRALLTLKNPAKATVAVSGASTLGGIVSYGDLDISGSGVLKVDSNTTAINVKSGGGVLSFSNDLTAIRGTQGNAISASGIVFNGIGTSASGTRLTIKDGLMSTPYTFTKGSSISSSMAWHSSVTMTGHGTTATRIAGAGPFTGDGGTVWLQVPKPNSSGGTKSTADDAASEKSKAWQNPFVDVRESDWFYGDVQYAVENDLFSGTGATTFSPNTPMTRGMLVTVLGRMAGVDIAEFAAPSFDDTSENSYYTPYVSWAAQNSIVTGYNEGTFGPNDPITRQDVAVVLTRYMEHAKMDIPVTQEYRIFADEDQVADYAKNATQLMNKLGIINGVGENTINPTGSATRAEVAAMMHRFLERSK